MRYSQESHINYIDPQKDGRVFEIQSGKAHKPYRYIERWAGL